MNIRAFDIYIIQLLRKISVPVARVGLFVVFFWFGTLKLLGVSPAASLVQTLYEETVPFLSFETFYLLFALFEMIIGALFLIPKAVRVVIPLLFLHMITTFLPLFFLPKMTWQAFLVPTLEGQYIIKNLVIIATAIFIVARMHPLPLKIR